MSSNSMDMKKTVKKKEKSPVEGRPARSPRDNGTKTRKEAFLEFLIITGGTLLVAIGIYFFKFPNNFSTGGVSGISIILGYLVPNFSSGTFMLILNVILLIIGFIFIGNSFGGKTVYCSILLSISTWVLEYIIPIEGSITGDRLLDLCIAILLPAIGSAILFNYGASTGGTDIIAMIIKKFTSMNISVALLVADIVIVMLAIPVFGISTWIYCALGFFAKAFVVNTILESINRSKYVTIVTEHPDALQKFITDDLHKDATVSNDFMGAFTQNKKCVFLTVVTRQQLVRLKKFIKKNDPQAFVIVSNTSDIVGRGFRELM